MDENRFDENYSPEGMSDDNSKTQELDSILNSVGAAAEQGITPRERFTRLNEADDSEKTRMMDSVAPPENSYIDYSESEPDNPVKRRKKKKKKQINHTRTMGQIFLGVLISVAALVVGAMLASRVLVAIMDFTGMAKEAHQSEVNIDGNMSVDNIVDLLHENGIVEMPSLFKAYIRFAKEENGFLDGKFMVSSNMSYRDIIVALKSEKQYTETIMVMIPEGYTAQQIGQLLEENYVCRAVDFEKYYQSKLNKYDFEEQIPDNENRFYYLEGYLFPDTYEFYVIDDLKDNPDFDTSEYAKQAAEKMYNNFESKMTRELYARMDELGLTLDETITLAAMIQREGTNAENMGLVSSVFHNRLDDIETFPNLESDTTYTYIDECITPRISGRDVYTDIVNAYDSYQCVGLPAGPICNPGMVAINAALYPEESDYYYFLASSDGVFYYARTLEQHEQNIIDAALRDED